MVRLQLTRMDQSVLCFALVQADHFILHWSGFPLHWRNKNSWILAWRHQLVVAASNPVRLIALRRRTGSPIVLRLPILMIILLRTYHLRVAAHFTLVSRALTTGRVSLLCVPILLKLSLLGGVRLRF